MRILIAVVFVPLAALLAACGAQQGANQESANQDARTSAESTQAQHLTGTAEEFERAQFDDPTQIDNEYQPFEPGTQWVYEGAITNEETGVREKHRLVVTATDLTKVVDGVRTLVVHDKETTQAGQMLEPEVRFHAQDNEGNVWYFGEYREEFEDGKLVEPRAWVPGQRGAREGISMQADPQPGTPSYAQGYAPKPVVWVDRGKVYDVNRKTCVPVGCYDDVVVIDEFERTKPGAFQQKYFAPGVGEVRVGWRGEKEKERETMVLVERRHLGPEALAKVRQDAIELDRRGFEQPNEVGPFWQYTKDVYRHTQPVQHTLQAE